MNLSLTNNERFLKSETQVKRKEKLPTFLGVSKPRFLTRLRAAPRRGDSAGPAAWALVSDLPLPRRVYTFNFTQSSIKTENQGARWGWQGPGSDTRHPPRASPPPLRPACSPLAPRGSAPRPLPHAAPSARGAEGWRVSGSATLRLRMSRHVTPCVRRRRWQIRSLQTRRRGGGGHSGRDSKTLLQKGTTQARRPTARLRGSPGPGADGLAPAPGAAASGRPASAP